MEPVTDIKDRLLETFPADIKSEDLPDLIKTRAREVGEIIGMDAQDLANKFVYIDAMSQDEAHDQSKHHGISLADEAVLQTRAAYGKNHINPKLVLKSLRRAVQILKCTKDTEKYDENVGPGFRRAVPTPQWTHNDLLEHLTLDWAGNQCLPTVLWKVQEEEPPTAGATKRIIEAIRESRTNIDNRGPITNENRIRMQRAADQLN